VSESRSPLGATEVHDLWSEQVGDTFRVFVGACGNQPEATIFVTDGNGLFGLVVDTVRLMQIPALLPPVLVVGIGYPGVATVTETTDLRVRDLTPTHWAAYPGSGGADNFLGFIHESLVDWLVRRFPTALASTVYFGHSFGGLFGVYALLGASPSFDRFIISSPSLYWDRYAINDIEQQRAARNGSLPVQAFFGIGALETDEGRRIEGARLPPGHQWKPPATHLDMVADLRRFTGVLGARGYSDFDMGVTVHPDEFHSTVPATVLTHGLRHVFRRT
jgi:predicted alpha/beta superfamily hydrolase